ncbi:MAG: AI-2E family transporter [Burkholderiaceae bacterium]|jgi:predicted PurR-regulated permease PerM|nr:AI-2E family transporter [Burkholderiaceae bacterium]
MPTDPVAASAETLVDDRSRAGSEGASVATADAPVVVEIEPSVGQPVGMRVAVGAMATIAVVAALWAGKALLMPVAFAVVLTLLLTPAVGFLNRFGLPSWLAAAVVMMLAIAVVGAGVLQLSSPAEQWLNPRSAEWSKLEAQLRAIKQPLSKIQGAQERVSEIAEPEGKVKPREVVVQKGDLFTTFGEFQSIAFGVVSTIVLAFFLLAADDLFLRKLVRVLPTMQDKRLAVGIARTIQSEIGRYFATVAMSNAGLAVATALVMGYIGMPSPAFWGVVVGLLNFIPYLGAATSLVLLTAAATVSLEGWQIAQVPLAFLALTTIEGQFVQPVLVGRRMQLNVVVTFVALMFGGWIWGLGGLFLAVPTLVVMKICADHIEALSTIGEFISSD